MPIRERGSESQKGRKPVSGMLSSRSSLWLTGATAARDPSCSIKHIPLPHTTQLSRKLGVYLLTYPSLVEAALGQVGRVNSQHVQPASVGVGPACMGTVVWPLVL